MVQKSCSAAKNKPFVLYQLEIKKYDKHFVSIMNVSAWPKFQVE